MIYYKKNMAEELRKRGITSFSVRKSGYFAQSTWKKISEGDPSLSLETLNKLCALLRCQPGDLIGVELTDEEKIKYF